MHYLLITGLCEWLVTMCMCAHAHSPTCVSIMMSISGIRDPTCVSVMVSVAGVRCPIRASITASIMGIVTSLV